MRLTVPMTAGISTILIAFACGSNTPPPPPTPTVNQDSIDSVAAARAAEQARQDSLRRAADEARIQAQSDEEAARAAAAAVTARVRDAMSNMVNFDYDRATIRDTDTANLEMKVRIMQTNRAVRIQIAGHCDDRGSDEYNLALGNRRAVSAMQYLVDRGIDASRISITSLGEERPLDNGMSEAAWARNRRAEFSITAGGTSLTMPSM
jgi:peptidoglycan-associated lipoprotein